MTEHGPVTPRPPGPWNRAPETQKLIDALLVPERTVYTDAELEAICGKSCRCGNLKEQRPQGPGYNLLLSACRFVLRQHHIQWKRVRDGGMIARADNDGIFSINESYTRSGRKLNKRAMHNLKAADVKTLDQKKADALRTEIVRWGTLDMFSRPGSRKALEAKAPTSVPDKERLLAMWNGEEKDAAESGATR